MRAYDGIDADGDMDHDADAACATLPQWLPAAVHLGGGKLGKMHGQRLEVRQEGGRSGRR